MQKTIKRFSNNLILLFLLIILVGCNSKTTKVNVKKATISLGVWKMNMDLNGENLPFNFTLQQNQENYLLTIINAEERISVNEIETKEDSIFIKLPVFDSEFRMQIIDSNTLEGSWINYYKGSNYKINSSAIFGESKRFSGVSEQFMKDINGKYEVTFSPNTDSSFKAIGIINQSGNSITGTFATETGDYRHLDGEFVSDSIFLSTFDGSHAFLFKAAFNDTALAGNFWSGTHWIESWVAKKNESFELRNPDSLTYIKEGFDSFNFNLKGLFGDSVSLKDSFFQNKVKIVQIMGSWCPNCLDETRYFNSLYKRYNKNGLEIVAIAFERSRSEEKAIQNVKNLVSKVGVKYPFLMGGYTSKDNALEVFPMLNHIMSYPTAIFIDKKGEIRKIHTGFYGPGTGDYYKKFTKETEEFIKLLLVE